MNHCSWAKPAIAAEKPDSGGTTGGLEGKMGVWMKSAVLMVFLGATALGLTGCGSTMRNYLEKESPNQAPSTRADLTMPPDLRLPPPGTTVAAPDPGASTKSFSSNQAALTAPPPESAPAPGAPRAAAVPPASAPVNAADSIYTQAGISIYKPDGTKKSDAELRTELQAYYLAQKKAKNPNYGSVFNIGNIFKDE